MGETSGSDSDEQEAGDVDKGVSLSDFEGVSFLDVLFRASELPWARKILHAHPNLFDGVTLGAHIIGPAFVIFCCMLREMESTLMDKVTSLFLRK
ncbi:Fiber Fb17-like protein [Corchorus olitorius]|uniref:Fiber Fb17-like protein n=1 Tax=Corchorus olitorius TaxID=93759 RepID=A0A1R3GJG4_9ROSI|nr:Fiber Fb17-like protein [Corchorus olitorius]